MQKSGAGDAKSVWRNRLEMGLVTHAHFTIRFPIIVKQDFMLSGIYYMVKTCVDKLKNMAQCMVKT